MSTANDVGSTTLIIPEQGQGRDPKAPTRKRRRPALACEQCRSRKVKCDRKFPSCDRCARMGQADACAYSDDIFSRSHAPAQGSAPSLPKRHAGATTYRSRQEVIDPATADSHAQAIRAAGSSLLGNHPHACAAIAGETPTQVTRSSMYLQGKDAQTRFSGQTNPMNMYSQVPFPLGPRVFEQSTHNKQFEGLHRHIQEVKSENSAINNLRAEFEAFKSTCKDKRGIEGRSLDGLLPPRQMADELVAVYLNCLEPTLRILHIPSFRRDYATYWENPQTAAPIFVAQLLAMMASVLVLHNSSTAEPSSVEPAILETALKWVESTESFIQGCTKRPDLRVFQASCLLAVARRVNGVSANQAWITTGNLIKLAMSAGYHREPNDHAKVSPFYVEMRRRIWATIVELHLQASVDRGMPPSVREGDFNTIAPMNLSDDAIDEPSSDLPTAEPLEVLTDSTFHAVLTKSLLLRLRICAWANSASIGLSYEDVLNLDEELSRHLNNIPAWRHPAADDAGNWQGSRIRVLLELILRQYIIILHTPFASLGEQMPKYAHSRRARLEAATTILCQFKGILQPGSTIRYFIPSDTLQAALAVCHELYMSDSGFGSSPILTVVPNFAESLISITEVALAAIETQVYTIGKKMPEFYVLAMALSLVKAKLWPESAGFSRSKVAEQILRVGYHLYTWKTQAKTLQTPTMLTPTGGIPEADAANVLQGPISNFQVNEGLGLPGEAVESDIFGTWDMEDLFGF
ncbi:hypothetical protein AJ80_08362 [Polytolypa hystricis UAMH7299]|uniref:Zn(2)-C6 fungal-type domain-containing protein n=1 Tax=Polytolypa hystricis (strain UAMH7299) TaxID=1447883 RepID=A0A2B7X0V3_POLH7|nr:hypothetical protein AJ80_08362 [Polytolypa hystricis UAMH7299]